MKIECKPQATRLIDIIQDSIVNRILVDINNSRQSISNIYHYCDGV